MIHFVGGVQGQNYKTSATVQIPKDITVFKKRLNVFLKMEWSLWFISAAALLRLQVESHLSNLPPIGPQDFNTSSMAAWTVPLEVRNAAFHCAQTSLILRWTAFGILQWNQNMTLWFLFFFFSLNLPKVLKSRKKKWMWSFHCPT